jgi:hypothetical protein
LAVDAGDLVVDAPVGTLTTDLRDLLRQHKPVLARFLAMKAHGVQCDGSPDRPPAASAKWPHHGAMGICCSCGDALTEPRSYGRCDSCQCAAEAFYSEREARQGDEVLDV